MSNPDSAGTPFFGPPRPPTMFRSWRSVTSIARRQVTVAISGS